MQAWRTHRDVRHMSIRMNGADGQAMPVAHVGVLHQQVASVHCHVIVAHVDVAVVDVGWRAVTIEAVGVVRGGRSHYGDVIAFHVVAVRDLRAARARVGRRAAAGAGSVARPRTKLWLGESLNVTP